MLFNYFDCYLLLRNQVIGCCVKLVGFKNVKLTKHIITLLKFWAKDSSQKEFQRFVYRNSSKITNAKYFDYKAKCDSFNQCMKKVKILARFAHSPRLSFTTNFPHKCQTKFFSDVGSIIETYAYSICVWQLAFLALQCFCGCCCRERLGFLRLLASFSWFRWGVP